MKNKIFVVVLASIICSVFSVNLWAQEQITIATYYPSPFGSYNTIEADNMQADRIAIGNGNNPALLADGVMNFLGLAADPVGSPAGSIYYNNATGVFRFFNGVAWANIGGAAGGPSTLVAYPTGPVTACPAGTHVIGVLNGALVGSNMAHEHGGAWGAYAWPTTPPLNGFLICD